MCKICKRLQADILKFHRGEKTALQEAVAALATWEGHADECEAAKQAKKRAAAFLQKHNASRMLWPRPNARTQYLHTHRHTAVAAVHCPPVRSLCL